MTRGKETRAAAGHRVSRPHDLLLSVSNLGGQVALAVGLTAVAAGARFLLGLVEPDVVSSGIYVPGIVLASLVGGWRAGAMALGLSFAANLGLFGQAFAGRTASRPLNMALFIVLSSLAVAVAHWMGRQVVGLRESRQRLQARNLHYDTLFETISEGFAVCEAIRDASGRLIDYTVLEMNPALLRLLGVGPDRVGGRMSDTPGDWSAWLALCERVLATGKPAAFEAPNRVSGRWTEIRVNRLTPETMAQVFIDITDRKTEQARQAALFDELNHRVKNNLAIVSAVLSMQARTADPAVAEALTKAVTRVHSIADLHASLYKSHRTEDVDAGHYLRELGASLASSLLVDERIRIEVDTPTAVMSTDNAVALGLVVSELVTNAVKHAYEPDQVGEIRVALAASDEGAVLTISDDGRGIAAESPGPEGLGLQLVRSMVGRGRGRGARFEIRLPASSLSHTAA